MFKRNTILLYLPTPPPFSGPEVANSLLLNEMTLKKANYMHLRSNVKSGNAERGNFDLLGMLKFSERLFKILHRFVFKDVGVIYLLLSGSRIGFIRDSIIILISRLFRIKVVAHYRGSGFDDFYENNSKSFKFFIRKIINIVSIIIVQGYNLKNMFTNITKNEIKVIYNGINVNGNKSAKLFGFSTLKILFVGHISYAKGFYDLIVAYRELQSKYDISLKFAGTPMFGVNTSKTQPTFLSGEKLRYYLLNSVSINSEIQNFVSNCQEYNAEYLGILPNQLLLKQYEENDIFVLPSYREGFPMSVLEAMSYGMPIIASRVGAIPEIIQNNINGYLLENISKKEIEDKIIYSVNNKDKLNIISETNIKYVKENYSINRIASQIDKLLNPLISYNV